MKRKTLVTLGISSFMLSLAMTGCQSQEDEGALSGLHSSAETLETMAPETTNAPTTEEPTTQAEDKPSTNTIDTEDNTHKSGNISIEYPSIINLGDTDKEQEANSMIEENALKIIEAYELDETTDTADIESEVITLSRKQIIITYSGIVTKQDAAYPINVYYTNTIDLNNMENVRFDDISDPYTMAGYVLSDDVQFYLASVDQKSALMDLKNQTSIENYTELFKNADFGGSEEFPQSFSYAYEGIFYFSIPVPHAAGDYAIVVFPLESK